MKDLELLAALFEDRWPAEMNVYELNARLDLPTWSNPALLLWRAHVNGEPVSDPAPGDREALEILRRVHKDYLATKGPQA